MAEADITTSPQRHQMHSYFGDQTPSIRLMMVVEAHPLVAGQTFQHKETLQICIAEEANLCNIKVKIVRSSHITYIVGGYNFYVATGYQMQMGWLVRVACCREGDDVLRIPPNSHYFDERQLRNPFRGKWIGYLLHSTIEDCPGATYHVLSKVILDYVNPYVVTNNIIQDARDHAKADIFGKPNNNIRYAYAIQQAIQDMGHVCELIFTGRRDVIQMIREIVLKEEQNCRQHANEPTLERGTPRMEFVNDCLLRHKVALTDALGTDNCPELKFLTRILVAPSTSKVQAPFLQDVIQADAAHMSFGKYTLFSAYANTANMTMASLGFAILFGNKDKHNWTTFWKFIKNNHPIVNLNNKTIITNQDKGSIATINGFIRKLHFFTAHSIVART